MSRSAKVVPSSSNREEERSRVAELSLEDCNHVEEIHEAGDPPAISSPVKQVDNSHRSDKSCRWYNGNAADLDQLRRSTDLFELDDINTALVMYSRTLELLITRFPEMPTNAKKDWSTASALSPDWFGDKLNSRLQNTMLVSALLLTVTAVSLMTPIETTGNEEEGAYRATFFLNGICCALFLLSIFLGICFVENAMSRAYCWSDRFCLIVKQYPIKDFCQVSAVLGTIIFPMTLLAPLTTTYVSHDLYSAYGVYGLYALIVLFCQFRSVAQVGSEQNIRTKKLHNLVDEETGRLRRRFFPPTTGPIADLKEGEDHGEEIMESIIKMYANQEHLEDSALGWIKLRGFIE